MNERLKNYMNHEEEILWCGHAEPFTLMDSTNKKPCIRRWITSALVVAAVIALYIFMAFRCEADIKVGVILVLLAFGIYFVVSPLLDAKKLKNSIDYVLTNEKLMIVSPSDVRSVKLDSIPIAALSTDEDGHTSLLCGEDAVKAPASKRRSATLVGAMLNQESMICESFVMYALDDVAGFRQAAKGYLSLN